MPELEIVRFLHTLTSLLQLTSVWGQSGFLAPDEELTDEESHHLASSRLRLRASPSSIMFTGSTVAHLATLPLKDFCELIGRCPSLERATIQRVECYKVKAAPKHRFLIFYCVRASKCPVWFRVDRRLEGGVFRLLSSRGTVNTKDIVRQWNSALIFPCGS